ncbi:MAG: sigma-70 family RNA polymerase sigma factor [Acidobacteriota bacterium]
MIPSIALDVDRGASVAVREGGSRAADGRTGRPGERGTEEDWTWEAGEDAFVERFGALIERLVAGALRRFRLGPGDLVPEDLLQEVYCRIFERGLFAFEGMARGQVVLYLKRVVRTTMISRLRADRALKRGGDWRRERMPAWQYTDPGPTPEDLLLERESRSQLLSGCRWLAEQGRLDRRRTAWIVTLVLAGGWTSREVAAASGGKVASSSVDSLLWRCRRQLEARRNEELRPSDAAACTPFEELPEGVRHMLRLAFQRRSGRHRLAC